MPRIPYRLIPPILVVVVLVAQVTVSFATRGVDSNGDTTHAGLLTVGASGQNGAAGFVKRSPTPTECKGEECGSGHHHTRTPTVTPTKHPTLTPTPTATKRPTRTSTPTRTPRGHDSGTLDQSAQLDLVGTPGPE